MGIQKVIGLTAGAAGIAAVCCVFASVASTNHADGRLIRLAHNQQDGTEIADSIAEFETFVEEEVPSGHCCRPPPELPRRGHAIMPKNRIFYLNLPVLRKPIQKLLHDIQLLPF